MSATNQQEHSHGSHPEVATGVYGLVTLMAVLEVLSAHPPTAWRSVGVLLGTTVGVMLADIYSELIAGTLARERWLSRAEVRVIWQHTAPLFTIAQLPTLVMLLAALGLISDERAITFAQVVGILALTGYGCWAGWTVHKTWHHALASGVALAAGGAAIVLIKSLVH